jgi:hypothetical protein
MKYKAIKDISISDISVTVGSKEEPLILKEGQYIPISRINPELFKKSLYSGSLKELIDKDLFIIEPDDDATEDEIYEKNKQEIYAKIIEWINMNDMLLKHKNLFYSGFVGQDIDVQILVTDGDGTVNIFADNTKAVISYSGSVDTSKIILKDKNGNVITNGGYTPYSNNGIIALKISSSIAQTITLTIVSNNRNLQIPNANAEIIIS